MPSEARETFFATCAPGVEPLLHAGLKALRLGRIERQVGGVRFQGTIHDAWRVNLQARTAVRVLLRLARFAAAGEDDLYRGVQAIDWRRFLRPQGRFVVSAQTRESRLDHSLFIEQRTKDAIVDQFRGREGTRPSVDREAPEATVHVHLWRDRCTVSADTSGASLHKRGWRRFQGRAPLAETLAAAVVLFSGWDKRSPLVDPFCGSGTLLIEAALIAGDVPAGAFREEFAFERFPGHDASAWSGLRKSVLAQAAWPRKLFLRGFDADAAAVDGAKENLAAAGLEGKVEVAGGEARQLDLKRGWNAWIVTNPPYGERLGESRDLVKLYRDWGRFLRQRCGGYRLAVLCGKPSLVEALDMRGNTRELLNGGLRCKLLQADVPRAS